MFKKICIFATIVLLLPYLVFGAFANVKSTSEPSVIYPSVHISPDGTAGLKPGEVFTVTMAISGLVDQDLYGFDIMFKWDTTALQCLSHEAKVPVETYPEGILHQPVLEVKNEINESYGSYWIAYTSLSPAEPFNGDGVFFTITFVLLQESNSNFTLEQIFLSSDDGETIPLSGCQNPETPIIPSISQETNEHRKLGTEKWLKWRKLRAEKWLEWWITVTWGMPPT